MDVSYWTSPHSPSLFSSIWGLMNLTLAGVTVPQPRIRTGLGFIITENISTERTWCTRAQTTHHFCWDIDCRLKSRPVHVIIELVLEDGLYRIGGNIYLRVTVIEMGECTSCIFI